jgi:hypothetical protein
MTQDIARKRDPVGERRAEDAVLPGKILALRPGPRGEWIFTLDNQQVWDQQEAEPSSDLWSVTSCTSARREGFVVAGSRQGAKDARHTSQLSG